MPPASRVFCSATILYLTICLPVCWGKESVRRSCVVSTTSSTNSVDVILRVIGVIVIDNKLDIINVETSGSHVRGHEDGGGAPLELAQDPISFFLLLVSVNTHSRISISSHESGQFIGFPVERPKELMMSSGSWVYPKTRVPRKENQSFLHFLWWFFLKVKYYENSAVELWKIEVKWKWKKRPPTHHTTWLKNHLELDFFRMSTI